MAFLCVPNNLYIKVKIVKLERHQSHIPTHLKHTNAIEKPSKIIDRFSRILHQPTFRWKRPATFTALCHCWQTGGQDLKCIIINDWRASSYLLVSYIDVVGYAYCDNWDKQTGKKEFCWHRDFRGTKACLPGLWRTCISVKVLTRAKYLTSIWSRNLSMTLTFTVPFCMGLAATSVLDMTLRYVILTMYRSPYLHL